MNRILVVANAETDLLALLRKHCDVTVIDFYADVPSADDFDALCVLGGTEPSDAVMPAPLHNLAFEMKEKGKPIFFEFVCAIFSIRPRAVVNTAFQRMVYRAGGLECDGVEDGFLFDGQSNDCINYRPITEANRPILTYKGHVCAHSKVDMSPEEHREGTFALWWYSDNVLVSSIRLCNFHRARFAPRDRWKSIISGIVTFLAGEKLELEFAPPVYTYREAKVSSASDTDEAIKRGIKWIDGSALLNAEGKKGFGEGYTNHISAKDGTQGKNKNVRADCTNEIGGALMFYSLLFGDELSRKRADALFDFTFNNMQIKSGEHKGMLRWSEVGWDDCYQDDVARAIIPPLLCQFYGIDVPHFDDIRDALDYLVKTTAKDGIRVNCTEMYKMTPEYWERITGETVATPCAHFNAFYHAALLLAYRICGEKKYLDVALRGLSALMALHPETRRETSETEEYTRLIFPLAVLYSVTGEKEHYDWLCRVADDLEKFHHSSGGYAEWDTGYKAGCSRNHNGECALLADNGDPVADLLYSNNWLPLGFAYAYLTTGEEKFYRKWCGTASFMVSAQMHSDLPHLDGAWARAFDMDTRENCGMPHDKGWGPHCIESGWIVGEILAGLSLMRIAEKKHGKI